MGKKTKEVEVYVLSEQPRWGEEKFMHGAYTCAGTLETAKGIITANHKEKGLAAPEFGVETITLDGMPFDWNAYKKTLDSESRL